MDGSSLDPDLLETVVAPSDVEAALMYLQQLFKRETQAALPLVVLRSHLYSVLRDRTDVDRDLDSLRQAGVVRCFKMIGGSEETALMFTRDYMLCLSHSEELSILYQAPHEHTRDSNGASTLLHHVGAVIERHREVHITKQQLAHLLSNDKEHGDVCDAAAAEQIISLLLEAGFLNRDPARDSFYNFAFPSMGAFVKSVVAGRKEVLSFVSRCKYKEVLLKRLMDTLKLKHSKLGISFHLRDLLGQGLLVQASTTVGPFIRVQRDQG